MEGRVCRRRSKGLQGMKAIFPLRIGTGAAFPDFPGLPNLGGGPFGTAKAVADPLSVTALVLNAGGRRMVFLNADCLGFTDESAAGLRQACATRAGI